VSARPPRVSVITIFLDAAPFLQETIDSVLGQTFEHVEHLLVDDGSSDGSTQVAKAAAAAHPDRIRYLEHPGHRNLGMSRSRNLGLRAARGEYVACLDADDVWEPDALEHQVGLLDRAPEAAMAIGATLGWGSWRSGGGEDRERLVRPLGLVRPPELALQRVRQGTVSPSMNAWLARRSAVEAVGGFVDEFDGMFEDQAFLFRFLLVHPALVHDRIIDRYRQHPGSAVARARATEDDIARAVHRHMRRFRAFAHAHVRLGPWRGTALHREVRWYHRWHRSPGLERFLRPLRPGLRDRLLRRLRRTAMRSELFLRHPYLTSPGLARTTRLRLLLHELAAALPPIGAHAVSVPVPGGRVRVRTDTLAIDLVTLEYCLNGQYFPAAVADRVVLDLGAHKGYFAVYCLHRGARAVLSVEPEATNHACLAAARVSAAGSWTHVRAAVGARRGTALLHVSTESWSHSLSTLPSGELLRSEEVTVVAFGDLLAWCADAHPGVPVVVKLNVEGTAGDCLFSVGPEELQEVDEVLVDVEETTTQSPTEIVGHLAAAGFRQVSAVGPVRRFLREVPDTGTATATVDPEPQIAEGRGT
jgi:FkbM family methyltransferase